MTKGSRYDTVATGCLAIALRMKSAPAVTVIRTAQLLCLEESLEEKKRQQAQLCWIKCSKQTKKCTRAWLLNKTKHLYISFWLLNEKSPVFVHKSKSRVTVHLCPIFCTSVLSPAQNKSTPSWGRSVTIMIALKLKTVYYKLNCSCTDTKINPMIYWSHFGTERG